MMMDRNERLIDRFKAGQRAAFAEVVSEHVDAVYRFLVNLTATREDAEDLCQETFLEAGKSAKSLRTEGSLRNWLYQIAYRRYLRWSRKRPRTVALTESDSEPSQTEQRELRLMIENAMSGLSDEMRAVFVLAQVEQFDLVEVATILCIPLGTVKSRLSRAKAALRLALGDPSHGEETDETRGFCSAGSK